MLPADAPAVAIRPFPYGAREGRHLRLAAKRDVGKPKASKPDAKRPILARTGLEARPTSISATSILIVVPFRPAACLVRHGQLRYIRPFVT